MRRGTIIHLRMGGGGSPARLPESWGFYTSHGPCMVHAQTIQRTMYSSAFEFPASMIHPCWTTTTMPWCPGTHSGSHTHHPTAYPCVQAHSQHVAVVPYHHTPTIVSLPQCSCTMAYAHLHLHHMQPTATLCHCHCRSSLACFFLFFFIFIFILFFIFIFFHFIVLWGGPYVGRYIQAWGPIKPEALHPRPMPMSLPVDAHCAADTCVPSMYGWVRLRLQLLRFVSANVV